MENVIYNELRYRGYSVDVGVVRKRKRGPTDASGSRCSRWTSWPISPAGVTTCSRPTPCPTRPSAQEKSPLLGIDDSFKKIVVVKDVVNVTRDEDGVVAMGLFDFLLGADSPEL